MLETEPDLSVVAEAADGAEAVRLAGELRPDIALLDIRMPGMDGLEAARRILADAGGTRVLMLTTFDLDEYVYEALRIGAGGFLLKDTTAERLVEGIRAVAAGEALLAPAVTRRLIEEFTRRPPDRPRPAVVDRLTARELEVFGLVARGLSNAEISRQLFLGETTVKTHVARVLAKLDLRDRIQAVVLAYESGVVRPGE
ncbi:response regulator [Blastococcus sp. SYSU DS0617]